MQTTSLRYFLAVARTGSIAAASAQLNVAASAISRQIANLEAELDCVLFERRPRGMVTSPAGELLTRHAHGVLIGSEQVVTEIRELQGLTRGFIRVASSEGFALDLMPNAIAAFHAQYPGIRFELSMVPPAQVTQLVASGDVDIGVTFAVAGSPPVAVVYDGTVEMVVVSAPDHPLAAKPDVVLSDLQHFPVALLTRDTTVRQVFDAACAAEGIAIEPVLTANILAALLPFVQHSRAVAPMSALSVRTPLHLKALALTPIRSQGGLMRGIQVQAMRERKLPHACQAFIRVLMQELPALTQ